MGKLALASLIVLSSGGSILAIGAVFGLDSSVARCTLVIKGPLGKDISQVIENEMGELVEIKE